MSNKQNDVWEENKRELKCMYCGGEGAMCQKCKEKFSKKCPFCGEVVGDEKELSEHLDIPFNLCRNY